MDSSDRRLSQIREWINGWASETDASIYRNRIRHEAHVDGYRNNQVGDWLWDLILGPDDEAPSVEAYSARPPIKRTGPRLGIHEMAKEMLADGFHGQLMRDEDNARDYICMAADNPDVEDELPELGFSFWRAAPISYKRWKARRNHGFG